VELLLLRLAGSVSLRLTVNPADAAWLREQPELLARLRVVEVDEDRRIERGGCRIQSDQREWDATLRGQLSALEEAIVASLEGGADARQGEEEDERGADHLHPVG
jgi:flagellar biosynthesis/type III secretory pathway protein FliH